MSVKSFPFVSGFLTSTLFLRLVGIVGYSEGHHSHYYMVFHCISPPQFLHSTSDVQVLGIMKVQCFCQTFFLHSLRYVLILRSRIPRS